MISKTPILAKFENLEIKNRELINLKKELASVKSEFNQIEKFFTLSIDLLCIADGEYFKKINPAFMKVLGYSEEDLLGKPFLDFIHPDDIQLTIAEVVKLQQGIPTIYFENRYRCKDGSYKWLSWTSSPVGDLLYAVAHDITNRKNAEAEFREILTTKLSIQKRQLLSFVHMTSHDLRGPVGNIHSLLSMYKESNSEEEKQFLFEKFETVVVHLSETLNKLVETLQIKEEENKEREILQFNDSFIKAYEMLSAQIMETKAEVISDFSNATEVNYPKIYLESIMLNLLSNALKYSSKKRNPKIIFKTCIKNGQTILTVTDNGLGIDLNVHGKKIFGLHKTFHRVENAKGIGLFMTKAQVEAMGGKISIESQVDKGSVFKIIFNAK
ncbi:MAG: PAS domain-containing sensor histidine kinase [Flavobacterium sp.]|jgi:PAS domain S-box-containing protein